MHLGWVVRSSERFRGGYGYNGRHFNWRSCPSEYLSMESLQGVTANDPRVILILFSSPADFEDCSGVGSGTTRVGALKFAAKSPCSSRSPLSCSRVNSIVPILPSSVKCYPPLTPSARSCSNSQNPRTEFGINVRPTSSLVASIMTGRSTLRPGTGTQRQLKVNRPLN